MDDYAESFINCLAQMHFDAQSQHQTPALEAPTLKLTPGSALSLALLFNLASLDFSEAESSSLR